MGVKQIRICCYDFIFDWFGFGLLWCSSIKKIPDYFLMKKIVFIIIGICIFLLPEVSYACATCFGDPNSTATQGMNKAILTMLGVTGGVLGGVVTSIFTLKNRARKYAEYLQNKKKITER
ncbi:uncharacterized protein METZ01_LOCUS100930 [marine metagenome]|uniref:Uncharacterized protein n=1 Tax=marine metagenome TaxID=408172 RepID=A0A381W691_9ZZZZ